MYAPNIQGAATSARPNYLRPQFPEAIRAARHAALIWFQSETGMTLSQFRDVRCWEHCQRHNDSAIQRHLRESAFRSAYAEQVGQLIVERNDETSAS